MCVCVCVRTCVCACVCSCVHGLLSHYCHDLFSFVVLSEKPSFSINLSKVPDCMLGKRASLKYTCMKQQITLYFTDDSHLSELVTALNVVHHWFELGVHLGLKHHVLCSIEEYRRGDISKCRMDMLAHWLTNGPESKRNKQFLQSALQKL